MINLRIVFFFCLISISGNAQVAFNNKYFDDDALRAEDFVIDSNALLVVGNKHMGFPGYEGFFHRIDQNGVIATTKIYHAQQGVRLNRIIQLADSTVMAVGEIVNPQTQAKNALCLRLNNQGDTIWAKSFGFGSSDVLAKDLTQPTDSLVVIVGNEGQNGFILGIRLSGEIVWSWMTTLAAGSSIMNFHSITNDDLGNVLVAGAYSSQMVNPSGILIKVDTTGGIVWSKQLVGISSFREVGTVANAIYVFDDMGSVLSKIDQNGSMQWSKVYSNFFTEGLGNDVSIQQDSSQNVIMTMNDGFYGHVVRTDSTGLELDHQMVIGKSINSQFNADGNLVVLGNGPVLGLKSSVVLIPHYGITCGVGFCSFSTPPKISTTSLNLTTFSLTLNGALSESLIHVSVESPSAVMQEDGCIEILGGTEILANDRFFSISPNPTYGKFAITGLSEENVTISIFDTKGNVLYVGNLSENSSQLDLSSVESGCYFVRIGEQVEKLVLTK